MKRYLIPSLLIAISVVVVWISPKAPSFLQSDSNSHSSSTVHEIHWKTLQGLDLKTGEMIPELKKVVDQRVKIPGFAVPLSDNLTSVEEFLFVPNQQACIHVPPPPPHLIIHVKLPTPKSMDDIAGPLWAEGVLRLKTIESMYGSSSWSLDEVKIDPYEW